MLRSEVENYRLHKSDDLVKLVEELGYKEGNSFPALQLNNGAHVTSLLNFFDDNPGAMELLQEWIMNRPSLVEEDPEEEEEEVEEEEPPTHRPG